MQCRQCGTEIAEKALICYRCGTATTEAKFKPHVSSGRGGRRRPMRGLIGSVAMILALVALALNIERIAPFNVEVARLVSWLVVVAATLIAVRAAARRR